MGYTVTLADGQKVQVETAADVQKIIEQQGRTRLGAFARGGMQGLTMGFGDEILSGLQALGPSTYADNVKENRASLDAYAQQFPTSTMGGNLVGGLAGAAATSFIPGLNAAIGARTIGTLERAAQGVGGGIIGTAVQQMGDAEGSAAERFSQINPRMVAAGGVAGGATSALLPVAVGALRARFGRVVGDKVQREILRAADESGLDPDAIIAAVQRGEPMANLSEDTANALRKVRAAGGKARTIANNAADAEYIGGVKRAQSAVTRSLADLDPNENLLADFNRGQAGMRDVENEIYERAFQEAPPLDQRSVGIFADAANRDPSLAREAAADIRLKTGETPFFDTDDAGRMVPRRNPTVKEAETFRRTIADRQNAAYSAGQGGKGEAYRDMERGLRSQLDDLSPDLRLARQTAHTRKTAADQFKLGQGALSKGIDGVGVDIAEINALPEYAREGAMKAYRAGLVHALKRQLEKPGSQAGIIRRLGNDDGDLRQILAMALPPEQQTAVLEDLARSARAIRMKAIVKGGSQTADKMADAMRPSAVADGFDLARGAQGGGLALAGEIAKKAQGRGFKLTEAEQAEIARILTGTDPVAMQRLLKHGSEEQFDRFIKSMRNRGAWSMGGYGGSTAGLMLSEDDRNGR